MSNTTPPAIPPGPRLSRATRIFIAVWLSLFVLGALNHNILPRAGLLLNLHLPHLRYGYVMFSRNFGVVAVPYYKPADSEELRPLAELVKTPAPFMKRTRTAVMVLMTKFEYFFALCESAPEAHGAEFVLKLHAPGRPEIDDQYRRYLCYQGQLYAEKAEQKLPDLGL